MGLDFKDVRLKPRYSTARSRKDLDCTAGLMMPFEFKSPLFPANMSCCIDFNLARELSNARMFYSLDRFIPYKRIIEWIQSSYTDMPFISLSVGVKQEDRDLLKFLFEHGYYIDYLTIDIAHGHSVLMDQMLEYCSQLKSNIGAIIAGNVTTVEAVKDLKSWGADVVKFGIAPGAGCSTYNCTGMASHTFSDLLEACKVDIPIIADGGIREPADVCKALVAGAKMVMAGSIFAACKESPAPYTAIKGGYTIDNGQLAQLDNRSKKHYYGSASTKNGNKEFIEGKSVDLPINNESYLDLIERYNQGIKSCMSYGGVENLYDMKTICWEQNSV